MALNLVRLHSGSTANEIARIAGFADPRVLNRRLSELERAGLIFSAGSKTDPITNKRCARWYAEQQP